MLSPRSGARPFTAKQSGVHVPKSTHLIQEVTRRLPRGKLAPTLSAELRCPSPRPHADWRPLSPWSYMDRRPLSPQSYMDRKPPSPQPHADQRSPSLGPTWTGGHGAWFAFCGKALVPWSQPSHSEQASASLHFLLRFHLWRKMKRPGGLRTRAQDRSAQVRSRPSVRSPRLGARRGEPLSGSIARYRPVSSPPTSQRVHLQTGLKTCQHQARRPSKAPSLRLPKTCSTLEDTNF